jgi:hypothetical protein
VKANQILKEKIRRQAIPSDRENSTGPSCLFSAFIPGATAQGTTQTAF